MLSNRNANLPLLVLTLFIPSVYESRKTYGLKETNAQCVSQWWWTHVLRVNIIRICFVRNLLPWYHETIHRLVHRHFTVLEKLLRWWVPQYSVFNGRLLAEIVGWIDRCNHSFYGKERCQISGVAIRVFNNKKIIIIFEIIFKSLKKNMMNLRRNDDQCKKPPNTACYSSREWPRETGSIYR